MKKEEFEWLKEWLFEILAYIDIWKIDFGKAMDMATEKYPPPIDEEKLIKKVKIGDAIGIEFIGSKGNRIVPVEVKAIDQGLPEYFVLTCKKEAKEK